MTAHSVRPFRMLAAVLALVVWVSCGGTDEPPPDILPRDRFTEVLLQAQLIEARMNHELVIEQRTDSPIEAYYEAMFKEQDVTREQFERTFRWYSERPERLKAVYEDVLTELSRRKEEVIHQDAP
ncbi:MAG: DUF4296 domain-containing protein [Flavobacteriales bacterium]|nr:DUF4296 domain-containing protein [Flavobacteriales bacterium]MCB0818223.1 DUF4296 domain-containing protein [Flavobacteriales bacterium]MCB9200943.1 DUF4296 domain-containing protein [Flavobacteriales bacterium]HPJ53514.1 DUF4296 domain-containing protein [Flavobacteriales bacterium]HRW90598.1 DUF4296 domain-containing protein [Flavobacteriales bacterium]